MTYLFLPLALVCFVLAVRSEPTAAHRLDRETRRRLGRNTQKLRVVEPNRRRW